MGIELVSDTPEQRQVRCLWPLHSLVRSFICFLQALWTRLTRRYPYAPVTTDTSVRLRDCEKGHIDVYQTRAQLLDALKRRDAADAAFEAQITALLAPIKQRLAEINCDSGVSLPQATLDAHRQPPLDLAPVPQIFYGRTRELDVLVDMLVPPRQARIALLGEAGAGTSALALALLHRPEMVWTFGARRFLVRSDAHLAAALGLDPHTPRSAVLATLAACPRRTLIVFDDLQDDTLLAALGRMPLVSHLLTMRAPMEPFSGCGYTILPVGPLPLPDARALFRAIADLPAEPCDEHTDALLVDVSVPPAPPAPTSLPFLTRSHSHSDTALVDALLHHAQCLPRGIVHLAQRAQYEPLPFLLASCVEEEDGGVYL